MRRQGSVLSFEPRLTDRARELRAASAAGRAAPAVLAPSLHDEEFLPRAFAGNARRDLALGI